MVEKEQLRQLDGLEEDGGVGVGGVLCEHKTNSVGLGFETTMVGDCSRLSCAVEHLFVCE